MNINENTSTTKTLVRGGMIAGIYVVLTLIANMAGLASGAVQLRISEALTVLPIYFAESIGGLTVGCFIANIVCGSAMPDIIFGTLATLIGAIGTRILRKNKTLAVIPPILSNAIIVPFVLKFAYKLGDAWWYLFATVGIGEILSCGVLGWMLIKIMDRVICKL